MATSRAPTLRVLVEAARIGRLAVRSPTTGLIWASATRSDAWRYCIAAPATCALPECPPDICCCRTLEAASPSAVPDPVSPGALMTRWLLPFLALGPLRAVCPRPRQPKDTLRSARVARPDPDPTCLRAGRSVNIHVRLALPRSPSCSPALAGDVWKAINDPPGSSSPQGCQVSHGDRCPGVCQFSVERVTSPAEKRGRRVRKSGRSGVRSRSQHDQIVPDKRSAPAERVFFPSVPKSPSRRSATSVRPTAAVGGPWKLVGVSVTISSVWRRSSHWPASRPSAPRVALGPEVATPRRETAGGTSPHTSADLIPDLKSHPQPTCPPPRKPARAYASSTLHNPLDRRRAAGSNDAIDKQAIIQKLLAGSASKSPPSCTPGLRLSTPK